MEQVICKSAGVYPHILTRGKTYAIRERDNENQMVRITGDHGRAVWIKLHHFINEGERLLRLTGWQFDDDPSTKELFFIELTLKFSDGSKRWMNVSTPGRMAAFLEKEKNNKGFSMKNLLVVRAIDKDDIDSLLKEMDEQDELCNASCPY